jgi:hypothetical protein
MRKILILFAFAAAAYADNTYSAYISTVPATIYSGRARVDFFAVVNSSNVAQNVYIGDDSTSTVKIQVYVGATAFEQVPVPSWIKFGTNVKASCADTYGNNKVKLFINVK